MTPTRRSFITATAALFCAPAIVRASSLMPVRAPRIAQVSALTIFDAGLDDLGKWAALLGAARRTGESDSALRQRLIGLMAPRQFISVTK